MILGNDSQSYPASVTEAQLVEASNKSLLWCVGPRGTVLECKICWVFPEAVTSAKQILRVCFLLSAGKPGLHFARAERR